MLEAREDLAIDLNAAGTDPQEMDGVVSALEALESRVEQLREKLTALKKASKPAAAEA